MVEPPNEIIELLKKYIREIENKNQIPIKSAFLFGSYAKGNFNELSDIDVALISDKFEGVRILDKDKIRRTTLKLDYRISPFPYSSEDFTSDDLFVKEILSTGYKII